MKPEYEQMQLDNEEELRQDYLDAEYDRYKDEKAEEQFNDLTEKQVEESFRQFFAEKRINNGRIFDIKTQRYEDEQ